MSSADTTASPSRSVRILEVGPRDGLQNEPERIPTDVKVRFIDALSAAGHSAIEVSSFVRADMIPQLDDAAEVFAHITRRPGTRYVALIPNVKGLERAVACGVQELALITAATDTFSRRNTGVDVAASLDRLRAVVEAARAMRLPHLWLRGYVSVCFVCPFEGRVATERVLDVVRALAEMGIDEIAVSDTIGAATPRDVERVVTACLRELPAERLALHMHDTYGMALANIHAALALGVRSFDASAGGLGGCPYAPGATGNVATEDVLYMLAGGGYQTGVSLERIIEASRLMADALGRSLPSRTLAALNAKAARMASA
jgi:isopropylmalate/homocitrate/citramalate synthase